ncbi:DUF2243 domain-containing protein [Ornithinimicrobium pratense]|uniref:DUF2243 domain-containing protein n=1 Tax=Ornithinimicrobium pratense TaxID=2593973 RepID=A0A5J6V552_9MICO|nr:DUF2243 domain-containing protein [Ornithinimicrobium pratense]QFG68434.1 DUF2243 domain-containing protein [Ornithinimicrobium pratense]
MVRTRPVGVDPRRSLLVGAVIGVAVMAAVDEIVFHQMLAWHHFYDRSTTRVGLLSDGLLHAFELLLLVAGFFLLADLRRRDALQTRKAWAGFLLGAGGFQLFDGVVVHKVLRLHQIRADVVDLLVYDATWIGSAILLLAAGAAVALTGGRRPRTPATSS